MSKPSWESVDVADSLFRMRIERGWIYGTSDTGGAPIALVFVPDPKPGISQEAAEDLLRAAKAVDASCSRYRGAAERVLRAAIAKAEGGK